ncbi:MAG: DUF2017 family protein [Actinomycetota bacterium]
MIRRPRQPIQRTRNGFVLQLDADERHLLRRLLGEIRDLVTTAPVGDAKMQRLFPPAYTDDAEGEADYQRLMREELVASRLSSIEIVDTILQDDESRTLSGVEVDAFAQNLNAVRLILGTLLNVGEDDDDAESPEMALYQFLSWLVDCAITALMRV